jgi:DNA-binding MurR/RpiR family transcriptional regulator
MSRSLAAAEGIGEGRPGVFSLQDRIAAHFDGLSPQLKVAARYIAEHPQEVAMRSLRQIAGRLALSPPTFTRLARSVGCETYEELREICRLEITRRTRTFAEKALSLQHHGRRGGGDLGSREPGALFCEQVSSAITNLEATLAGVDQRRLAEAADVLAAAERVLLIGSLSSAAFIDYMAYMAGMAFPNWQPATKSGASVPASLVDVSKQDAVLVVTKSPYARRSVEGVGLAHRAGAQIIAITDGVQSPVMRFADHSFIVATDSRNFFPSHVATVVLLETLIGMVIRRSGKPARRRIAAVNCANRENGEYWHV